jgi:hypothetical protein
MILPRRRTGIQSIYLRLADVRELPLHGKSESENEIRKLPSH